RACGVAHGPGAPGLSYRCLRAALPGSLVERHESQLRDVVEQWREMPDVPRRADYERVRLPRPFEETEPAPAPAPSPRRGGAGERDRKSTRLNSSHVKSSYGVFCLEKKR